MEVKKNINKIIKNAGAQSMPFRVSFFMSKLCKMNTAHWSWNITKWRPLSVVRKKKKVVYSRGILCSSFMNLSLTLENISSLVSRGPGPAASVLLTNTSGAALGAGFPTRASLRLIAGCGSQTEAKHEKMREGYSYYLEYLVRKYQFQIHNSSNIFICWIMYTMWICRCLQICHDKFM